MAEILLVEDDDTVAMSIEASFELEGHRLVLARNLAEARRQLQRELPDLVLLDLGLPDGDGLVLCRDIEREGWALPVLVLTARSSLDARVAGLRGGADDYLTKPFDMRELLARVEALLRRATRPSPSRTLRVGRLEVDLRTHEASRDGEPVTLTALELKLLRYLRDRPGQVTSREELLGAVWGLGPETRTRTVDVFISRLRRYIEPNPAEPRHLLSVRGVGYRLMREDETRPDSS